MTVLYSLLIKKNLKVKNKFLGDVLKHEGMLPLHIKIDERTNTKAATHHAALP